MFSVRITSITTLPERPGPFRIYFVVFVLNTFDVLYAADTTLCWPFNFVPYAIRPGFSPYQQNYIKEQIDKINNKTCLYWADMNESKQLQKLRSFVRFQRGTSGPCNTQTLHSGYVDDQIKVVVIVTLPDYCFVEKHVLHEIVHALGFEHEQQRIDRDCYVWVSETAKEQVAYELDPYYFIPNLDRFPYDKLSVMHYRRSGDLKALSERFYQWEPLGNDEEALTDMDLWKIQYRFCKRPHYCEVNPQHCEEMEKRESEMNCVEKNDIK